ncbi:MAG: WhiB family transcriptional regulator [Candidatus Saccharimonadales bacterium]
MGEPLRDDSEQAFMSNAECAKQPPFYTFHEAENRVEEAKLICGICAVRNECLNYALKHPGRTQGWVYGGLTTAERADISAN